MGLYSPLLGVMELEANSYEWKDIGKLTFSWLQDAGGFVGPCSIDQQGELVQARFDLLDGARPGDHAHEHDLLPESPVDERGGDRSHDATTTTSDAPSAVGSTSIRATR